MWKRIVAFGRKNKAKYNYERQMRGENLVRIAICDDEPIHRANLRAVLKACEALPKDAVLVEYSDGASLLDGHAKNPNDIIFLDIEMEGISGLETGQRIRNADRNVIIIFLTSHKEYVFTSFRLEPFGYIMKPIDIGEINEHLNRAIIKHKEQHYIVDFKWKDKPYALKICDIVYLESDKRHINFYTDKNEYKCIGKLEEYEHRLSPYGFLRCHQSILINMNYIRSIEKDTIKTTLGKDIDMSIRKKQHCLNTFNEFVTKYRV